MRQSLADAQRAIALDPWNVRALLLCSQLTAAADTGKSDNALDIAHRVLELQLYHEEAFAWTKYLLIKILNRMLDNAPHSGFAAQARSRSSPVKLDPVNVVVEEELHFILLENINTIFENNCCSVSSNDAMGKKREEEANYLNIGEIF